VLLVEGVVVGIWERRRSGGRFELRVESFVRLSAGQRAAVQAQAARIGEIVEAPVTLSFGAIRRRPHL
jgi:DNA glycosylase AlkZ-like